MKKIDAKRLRAQMSIKSISRCPLKSGDTVEILDVILNNVSLNGNEEICNDNLICQVNGGHFVRISMREYLRMSSQEQLFIEEEGVAILPTKFVVLSCPLRKNHRNEPVYPLGAYKEIQRFYDGEISHDELLQSGLKERPTQNHVIDGFHQKRDYTIEIA